MSLVIIIDEMPEQLIVLALGSLSVVLTYVLIRAMFIAEYKKEIIKREK